MGDYARIHPEDEETERYECPACGEHWRHASSAGDCCIGVDERWVCFECGNYYEFEDEARECCRRTAIVKEYICTVDGCVFGTADEAEDCCTIYDDEGKHIPGNLVEDYEGSPTHVPTPVAPPTMEQELDNIDDNTWEGTLS